MRAIYLLFGVLAYCIFFATFLYMIGFVADLPGLPATVDSGLTTDMVTALIGDVALIAIFAIQHSVMARQRFKRAWTRIVPQAIERSMYVLITSLVLILLFVFWRPQPAPIWSIDNEIAVYVLWCLFALGWAIVLLSTFLLGHFELFGLQQVWFNLTGNTGAQPELRRPFFYRIVRHPLYSGFFIAFWATPGMSLGHLVFAIGMSIYMLLAIPHEERDLVTVFGDDYATYQREVGMLAPGVGRKRRGGSGQRKGQRRRQSVRLPGEVDRATAGAHDPLHQPQALAAFAAAAIHRAVRSFGPANCQRSADAVRIDMHLAAMRQRPVLGRIHRQLADHQRNGVGLSLIDFGAGLAVYHHRARRIIERREQRRDQLIEVARGIVRHEQRLRRAQRYQPLGHFARVGLARRVAAREADQQAADHRIGVLEPMLHLGRGNLERLATRLVLSDVARNRQEAGMISGAAVYRRHSHVPPPRRALRRWTEGAEPRRLARGRGPQ